MDQCPKCKGNMDAGQVSVGEDLRYVSQRQKGAVLRRLSRNSNFSNAN
jgi:hypothetical protein